MIDSQIESNIQSLEQTNTLEIKKCVDSTFRFLTDPDSPYHTLPENVKTIFIRSADGKSFTVSPITKSFLPRLGKTDICTRIFPNNTQYYTCRQCCCQTKPGVTMCFCEPCWEPEKHVGHHFELHTSGGSAYCDCGRQSRIKPQSFCKQHGDKSKKVIQIPENERKQFVQFFEPLIMCYLYLKINQQSEASTKIYQMELNKKLESVCIGSLFYIRLLTEIMLKKVTIIKISRPILQWILIYNNCAQKMLFAMTADNEFKYKLIKVIGQLQNNKSSTNFSSNHLRLVMSELYQNDSILLMFAEEGEFIRSQKKRYLEMAKNSKQGITILMKYLEYEQKNQSPDEYLTFLISLFNDNTTYTLIMGSQTLADKLLSTFLDKYEQISEWAGKNYKHLIPLVSVCIFSKVNCFKQLQELSQIVVPQVDQANFQDSLEQFLLMSISHLRQYILKTSTDKHFWIVVVLQLINKSSVLSKITYIKRIWQSITEKESNLKQDLTQIFNSIYHLTALIANSEPFFNALRDKQQQDQEQMEKRVKSYLYQNKEVARNQIYKMRQKGEFNFANSGKKFQQLCKYNEQRDIFQYISQQKHPNYLIRFKLGRNVRDLKSIQYKNFKMNEQFVYIGSKYIEEIMQMLFGNEFYIDTMIDLWTNKLKNAKQNSQISQVWKTYDITLYYVFILVFTNVISKGKNVRLVKQIKNIRQNLQVRNQLYSTWGNAQSINNLLEIFSEDNKQLENQQSPVKSQQSQQLTTQEATTNAQKLLLFKEKRKRIAQKFKKTSQKFISQFQTKKQQSSQSQLNCIICREGDRQEDKLMYIGSLQKNTSLTNSIYGNDDKTQINIKSCLHVLHFSCYTALNKANFDFNCPLCAKKSNIYLPINGHDRKSIRRCSNVINAIEVLKYKNYDFHSLLMFFIRHLIGSYGSSSIIMGTYNLKQRKAMNKINQIILNMAKQTYNKLIQPEKEQFEEQYNKFVQSIETCQKQILKRLHKLFANVILNEITNSRNLNMEQLSRLKQFIIQNEFQFIKQNLQYIIEQKIEIPASQQQSNNSEKQSLSIQIKQLPSKASEVDSFIKKVCVKCENKQTRYFCLLCNKCLCHECFIGNQHDVHNSNKLFLEIVAKKLHVRQQGGKINGQHNIYFDPFMTPFEDMKKYKSTQVYELNEAKFKKLFSSYVLRNE